MSSSNTSSLGTATITTSATCQQQQQQETVVASSTSNSNSNSNSTLDFNKISNYFSLSIADAASTLGVCTSVLKRICRENGVARWPYRKFIAGKTVEDILKEAARERKKEQAELSKASRLRNDATSLFASSSLGDQIQNKNSMNTTQAHASQQQGNKQIQNGLLHHASPSPANVPAIFDEFKQGFPSKGLSTTTIRWWGSNDSDGNEDEIFGDEIATDQLEQDNQQCDSGDNEGKVIQDRSDVRSEKSFDPQGTALLLSVRERVVAEGREALKLGFHRGC